MHAETLAAQLAEGRSRDPPDRGTLRRERNDGSALASALRAKDATSALRTPRRREAGSASPRVSTSRVGPVRPSRRRGTYRCSRCNSEAVSERRRRVKALLVAEAGGSCVTCGFDAYA